MSGEYPGIKSVMAMTHMPAAARRFGIFVGIPSAFVAFFLAYSDFGRAHPLVVVLAFLPFFASAIISGIYQFKKVPGGESNG